MFCCFRSHCDNDTTPQLLSFNLDDMLQKAKKYSGEDTQLLDYIKDILNDSQFQMNPKGYLTNWNKKRTNQEDRDVFKYPEDTARLFFNENFKF